MAPADSSGGPRPLTDKRDSERVPILGDLQGEIMVFHPMTVKEIGRRGAQVETTFPLQLNSLHEVRLTLGDRSIVVKGRVAHSRISDVEAEVVLYRSGLEFIALSDRAANTIAQFLDAIRDGRRGN